MVAKPIVSRLGNRSRFQWRGTAKPTGRSVRQSEASVETTPSKNGTGLSPAFFVKVNSVTVIACEGRVANESWPMAFRRWAFIGAFDQR